jgi:3-hydroxyisobutyrate dehydrogenase-like beta-hydroxyacid dehydrogenase
VSRLRICLVGAGRMGRALSTRLAEEHEVVLVSRRAGRMTDGEGRGLDVGSDPAAASGCPIVLLAVPAHEIAAAAAWVCPHVDRAALVVNLATELPTADVTVPGLRLVGCKIIGQSAQIERGRPAALIAGAMTDAERALLFNALGRVGVLIDGPEELAARVNDLVARRMIAAQFDLVAALDELGVPPQAREAALGNLAVGIWGSVASGDTGPFLTRIVEELRTPAHSGGRRRLDE